MSSTVMLAQVPQWLDTVQAVVGAFVIPVGAVVWALVFILVYLNPMLRMQREGLKLGRETSDVLAKLDREVTPLIGKADAALDKINALVERFEKRDLGKVEETLQQLPEAIRKVEGHMAVIRERIEKSTAPIPVRRRPEFAEAGNDGEEAS